MKIAAVVQGLTVVALAAFIALSIVAIRTIEKFTPSAQTTLRDLHVTILEAGLTLKNLREASEEWKNASRVQAEQSTAVITETRATLKSVRLFVKHSDASVGTLLASVDAAVAHQDQALLASQEALRQNLVEMQKASVALQGTLADADRTIADPRVKEIIAHLDDASGELVKSSQHLTAMFESGQATAADVQKVADKVAYEYTKTRNLAWALFKELLNLGGSAAQIVK